MTSEPTKAIKSVAVGRPYRISYGGTARPAVRRRRRRDVRPGPDPAVRGGRRVQPAGGRRADRAVRERTSARRSRQRAALVTHGDRQLPIAPDLDDDRLQKRARPDPPHPAARGDRRDLPPLRRPARSRAAGSLGSCRSSRVAASTPFAGRLNQARRHDFGVAAARPWPPAPRPVPPRGRPAPAAGRGPSASA